MNGANSTAVVAYIASPHNGYLEFFRKYEGATLCILGEEVIAEFPPLVRHLPGNRPEDARAMIEALSIFRSVSVVGWEDLARLQHCSHIVMPDEDVSRAVAERCFAGTPVTFDGSWRLRWDWGAAMADRDPEPDGLISAAELDRVLMHGARAAAGRSPDWWRQVGALLAKDGEVLLASYNEHVPHEQSAYLLGDPRSNFGPGQSIEVSSAIHAEAALIATAAEEGIRTQGCDMYLTVFPCPPCAASVAYAGIRRLYYAAGYSRVDGAAVLRSRGVELIRVLPDDPSSSW